MAETTAAPAAKDAPAVTAAPAKTAAPAEKAPAEYEIVEHWQTRTISGVVESVDLATRKVGIRGPEGNLLLIKAGEEVERLDEMEVGDAVVAEYHISVVGEFREPTPEEEANPLVFLETAARAPRVMSSAVGPSPPVIMTMSASPIARRIVRSSRSASSPTVTCSAIRTAKRESSPDSQAEFVSTHCPVTSSVPMLMITASIMRQATMRVWQVPPG